MVDEPIDGGERHCLVWENFSPFAKWLICGDEQGTSFVAGADQLEENAGFRLILGDVSDIVKNEQVIFVELVDGGFQGEIAPCELQFLDEIGRTGEENAPSVLDEGKPERRREMRLSASWRPKQYQVGAVLDPAVTGGERHDMRFTDHRHGVEVEGVECFARRQPGFIEMTLDPAPGAFGRLVFGECREEARGRPTLLVGTRGEVRPDDLYGGQPEIGEGQGVAGRVDRIGGLHAAPPSYTVPRSS